MLLHLHERVLLFQKIFLYRNLCINTIYLFLKNIYLSLFVLEKLSIGPIHFAVFFSQHNVTEFLLYNIIII